MQASYALTPNTVELIPTLGAFPPPRRARPGPGLHKRCPASGRRGNTFDRFKDFYLKAKARIWPWLSYVPCSLDSGLEMILAMALRGEPDYLKVDALGVRYTSVNFGAEMRLRSPLW